MRARACTSIATPTAWGVAYGTVFLGGGIQQRPPFSERPDAAATAGVRAGMAGVGNRSCDTGRVGAWRPSVRSVSTPGGRPVMGLASPRTSAG